MRYLLVNKSNKDWEARVARYKKQGWLIDNENEWGVTLYDPKS